MINKQNKKANCVILIASKIALTLPTIFKRKLDYSLLQRQKNHCSKAMGRKLQFQSFFFGQHNNFVTFTSPCLSSVEHHFTLSNSLQVLQVCNHHKFQFFSFFVYYKAIKKLVNLAKPNFKQNEDNIVQQIPSNNN